MKILFILPHYDFDDDEYFVTKGFLESKGLKTETASTHISEAEGRFRKIIKPDFAVDDVRARDYDAFVFVGGPGAKELYHNTTVTNLVGDILVSRKVIALIGEAVPILYYANVLKGRQVTTLENLREEIEDGGGYYTGTNMEQDGDLITGFDDRSTEAVADAIVRGLAWQEDRTQREHLRK